MGLKDIFWKKNVKTKVETSFCMEDNDEVNTTADIDTQCRVVVKFQDLEDDEKCRRLREEAIKALPKEGSEKKNTAMNDFEKKALDFVSKKDEIVQDKSQKKKESLFSILDCLSLRPGYRSDLN